MSEEKKLWANVHQASKIYILPNAFTAGNLFFGFLSIILCIQAKFNFESQDRTIDQIAKLVTPEGSSLESGTGYYMLAILCILMSFFCDAFDGRVARASGKLSLFGKEFDSLADSVSLFVISTGWLIGFIFMLCAAVRLGRFNVLTNPYIEGHEKYEMGDFAGLPAPAAAGAVASIALTMLSFDLTNFTPVLIPLMLLISFFMVSNIPYPSFKHINWTTSTKFRSFVIIIICILLIVEFKECSFALIFLAYVFYPPIKYLPRAKRILTYKYKKVKRARMRQQGLPKRKDA